MFDDADFDVNIEGSQNAIKFCYNAKHKHF